MGAVFSVIKKIFGFPLAAARWLNADSAKVREARARTIGIRERTSGDEKRPCETEPFDPWEELDDIRRAWWFGGLFKRKS